MANTPQGRSLEELLHRYYNDPCYKVNLSGARGPCDGGDEGWKTVLLALTDAFYFGFSDYYKGAAAPPRVCIGNDGRLSGDSISEGLMRLLNLRGVSVHNLGRCSTPEVAYAARHWEAAGFQVTSSHNPPEYNGLKIILPNGVIISGELMEMMKLLSLENADTIAADLQKLPAARPKVNDISIKGKHVYIDMLFSYISSNLDIMREFCERNMVIVDANGGAGCIALQALGTYGMRVLPLQGKHEYGRYGREIEPTPTSMGRLLPLVHQVAGNSNALVSFTDHDGDRGEFIWRENGLDTIVNGQDLFCSLEWYELERRRRAGVRTDDVWIVTNNATTPLAELIADRYGARIVEVDIGEYNVVSMMRKLQAEGKTVIFGGEGSNGGNIFPGCTGRDALLSLLKVIEMMAHMQMGLGEIIGKLKQDFGVIHECRKLVPFEYPPDVLRRGLQNYFVPLIGDELPGTSLSLHRISTWGGDPSTGYKLYLSGGYRLLFRPSATEAGVRVIGFGKDPQLVETTVSWGRDLLKSLDGLYLSAVCSK